MKLVLKKIGFMAVSSMMVLSTANLAQAKDVLSSLKSFGGAIQSKYQEFDTENAKQTKYIGQWVSNPVGALTEAGSDTLKRLVDFVQKGESKSKDTKIDANIYLVEIIDSTVRLQKSIQISISSQTGDSKVVYSHCSAPLYANTQVGKEYSTSDVKAEILTLVETDANVRAISSESGNQLDLALNCDDDIKVGIWRNPTAQGFFTFDMVAFKKADGKLVPVQVLNSFISSDLSR